MICYPMTLEVLELTAPN